MKTVFTYKGVAKQGYPIIGAGICNNNRVAAVSMNFKSINGIDMKINDLKNPYLIDKVLYEGIKGTCSQDVMAIGASIYVPKVLKRTGGIIGNPLLEVDSASGFGENIGNGLSVAAHQGGPGIIIKGDCHLAEKIIMTVKPEKNWNLTKDILINELKKNAVDIAIIVWDGSGWEAAGCVLAYEKGKVTCLTFSDM